MARSLLGRRVTPLCINDNKSNGFLRIDVMSWTGDNATMRNVTMAGECEGFRVVADRPRWRRGHGDWQVPGRGRTGAHMEALMIGYNTATPVMSPIPPLSKIPPVTHCPFWTTQIFPKLEIWAFPRLFSKLICE